MTIDPEETGNTGFWKATGDKRCTQRTIGLYNTVLSHPLPQQVRGVGRQVLQPAAICQPKLASDLTRGCLCCCCSKVTTEGYASTVVCLCAQYFLSCLAPAPIPFVKNLFSKPASSLSAQAMEHARVNFIFHIFFSGFGGVVHSKYLYCSAAAVPLLQRSDAAGNNFCSGDTSHLPPFRSR